MNPEAARQYRERWALVVERERDELRRQTFADKLRQVAALMLSVDAMGWRAALGEDDDVVRQRWQTLRRRFGSCR